MSFAVPTALFWAALAVPIVVLYILKVRMRRAPVSTTMFWKQVFDEKPPRSIWQTLRHLISLLLQLALLALLVLALADPFFSWQALQAQRVVLVLDNSASMSAADVEPTRLEGAKQAARDVIEGLRFRDELAVVLAGPQPEVVIGMSGHVPTLKRAVDGVAATDGPSALAPAVELGRRLIGDHPHGRIVVLTDACTPDVTTVVTAKDVELRTFGTEAANVGITQFQVRRSLLDPLGYEVLIAVRNASKEPVECRLQLELVGNLVDILPLKLAAEETWSRSIEKTAIDGGRLVATLQHDDALAADNSAWAILPARERQRVLVVTPGNLFLQKVFEANPLVDVQVTDQFPAEWPAGVLTVLHRNIPEQLPPGDVWVVDPTGSCDLWTLGGDLENPIVTEQDKASPVMTHVRLDNVVMPQARQLTFKSPVQVLAGALSGDPIFAAVNRPGGKGLVLTVNLDEGDLAFRTAFPIMVANSLGWFAGDTGELRESLPTGAITQVPVPGGLGAVADAAVAPAVPEQPGRSASPLQLRDPHGTLTPLTVPTEPVPAASTETTVAAKTADAPKLTVGPLRYAGVWQIVTATGDAKPAEPEVVDELACNIASTAETDVRPPEEFRTQSVAAASIGGWFTRPLWFYLVAIAFALTTIEWWLYQRRHIT
jgi:hypothetical protein